MTKIIFSIILITFSSITFSQQWEIIGPPGGRVYHVAVDPKNSLIVYAGSDIIFRTKDGGITTKILDINSYGVLVDPYNTNIIYSGVSKSTDYGDTWQRIQWPVDAINPINTNHVYGISAAPDGISRLYVSYDAGDTWSIRYTFNTGSGTLAIAHSDTNIFYIFSYDSGAGIYKSITAGTTWKKTTIPIGNIIRINPLNENTVYILRKGAGGKVYKSSDGGNSYIEILSQNYMNDIVIHPLDTNLVYVVNGDYLNWIIGNVYKSTDGGSSWIIMNNGLPDDYDRYVYAVDVNPQNKDEAYIGLYGFGVYKTTDGAESWQWTNISQAPVLDIYCDPFNQGHIYAGTWDEGIIKTTNYGKTWSRLNFDVPRTVQTFFKQYAINPNNRNIHFAAGGTYGLFKSTNYGQNWQLTSLSGFGISTLTWEIAIHPTNSETLYVGQSGYMFRDLHRSTDGGNTFENLHITNSEYSIEDIKFDPTNPSIIYVCAQNKGILKSTDNGKNWFTINNGLKIADSTYSVYLRVSSIAVRYDYPQILFTGQGNSVTPDINGGLFKSTNAGESWYEVITGLDTLKAVGKVIIAKTNPERMYVNTQLGVLKSDDGGYNWKIIIPNLNYKMYKELNSIDPFYDTKLYMRSNFGIFTYKDTLTSVENNVTKGFQYILHQNYPNPFNSQTTINYTIRSNGIVTIKIYNILGKEVKSFQVQHYQLGEYKINWDGTDKNGVVLPSGVYFFCMQINNFFDVKKMILLR